MNELEVFDHVKRLKIKHFRGIFMRDTLPARPNENECGIVNLDSIVGPGTHWVAYCKYRNAIYYFDSYGNLQPPKELLEYFGDRNHIYYNSRNYQKYGTTICGQLCIQFLHHFNKRYYKFK
jgi:hypothetical protein